MANDEHLALLMQGAVSWNRWRSYNPEVTPDLAGAALRGADLRDANLARSDLRGAYLSGANLHDVNLERSDLTNANLETAILYGTWLEYAILYEANLSGAKLNWAHFEHTSLHRADLHEASLVGAKVRSSDLTWANLSKADLSGAVLMSGNLTRTDLSEADLSGADLSGMHLNATELDGAHFSAVTLSNASFSDVDLSAVKGLDSVIHRGPSSIGIDTIYKSRGAIPEAFLRGCGLDETLISYLPSLMGLPIQFYSCFISYSHQDASFARRLYNALQGRGIRCWLDEKQLLPGDDIYEQVDRGIRLWDKVLLYCSKDALTSWWVDNEIDRAFRKERRLMTERGKKVLALIPLNLDGYLFSDEWESGKKQEVLSRLAPDFTDWDKDNSKFEAQFEQVVKALQTDDTGREAAPVSHL